MASPLPRLMKTIHQPSITAADLIVEQVAPPTPSHPEDVLVKVYATAPCLGELWWARDYAGFIPADREAVPCPDVSGVVVSAPPTSKFKPGDEVFARTEATRPGNGREYTLVREVELALKPSLFDWIQAAATPLSALTAYQGVFVHGTLNKAALDGDAQAREQNSKIRVLITGAGGNVGSWAVQLAAAAGAGGVVAVARAAQEEMVRGLGATELVDYTKNGIDEWAKANPAERECDLIFDCVGGATLQACWGAVKTGGVLLTVSGGSAARPEGVDKQVAKHEFFIMNSLGSQLQEISNAIDGGKYKLAPMVDSVVEFDDFQKAFDVVDSGKARGKVVIKVA